MAKLTTHSIGGEVLACACALFGAVSQAQTLNLPATLSSGAYAASSTVTNCTGTVSQANCTSVTLANNATVTLAAATQIVLGPGFTAVAGNASTSLVAAIVPAPTVSAVTVSPGSVTSGGSATITVTLSSNALYGAVAVALSSSNTAAFNPPASITVAAGQINGSATVTAGTVSASTPVTVTGGGTQTGSVTVLPPPTDFTITLTPTSSPATTMVGGSATFTVSVSPTNSFKGVVTLTALGLPTGASASFSPATITGSGASTMTVTAPSSAGNIAVVATGTSGSLAHNASTVLAVQDFTFVLSPAYPSPVTVLPNGQTVVTAFTGGLNGFGQQGQTISLAYRQVSIGGLTPCALPQADWSNDYSSSTSVAPGQQATLLLQAGNANQYYCTFQVTASYGSTQHSQYGYLIQQGTGGFLLSAPAQQTVAAGQTATFPAAYTPYAGFNGNVTYSLSGQVPSGATASFTALSSPQLGSALNVYVPPGTLATTYGMTITASSPSGCTPGSSGCASQSVGAQLVVQSGLGFSITATPVTSTTVAPGGTAQYNITVNSSGGYTGAVNLSTSGGPSAASVTLSAYSVQAGGAPVTLTIATTANTPLSTYSTVVTATSGSVSQYGAAPLIVTLPAAASMLTPPPGANIAGGNTTFTWNAGLGATQYTVTAVTTNGQTSATTGPGQLSATLSLPATTQTATVTLQTTTASGALMQYYSYTIQPSGTAQWLTLAAGNMMPTLVANGQEALYTFTYNSSGNSRPSPQDIGDCDSTEVAIRIRIANLTASTATLGFTAPIGTPTAQFEWECNDGDGPDSGGGGTGTTGDPTPEIDSVSPVPLAAGTTTAISIQGEYFGLSGSLDFEEGCSQSGDIISWSDGSIAVYVSVGAGASTYCTVAVNVAYDDSGNSFVPGDGSSPESEPFLIPLEGPEVAAQMQCNPAAALRGANVMCSVSGVSANAVSGGSFSGGGIVVNGPANSLTWSGVIVASGTVTAVVSGMQLSQAITINPRSWHVNPAQPTQVANGSLQVVNAFITLPTPPATSPGPNGVGVNSGLGASTPAIMWTANNPIVIGNGPNAGFAYYATPLTVNSSTFNYEINPDLQNQYSVFSQAQCINSATYISWVNLITQTNRHEWNSATESHWAFYVGSMNNNNVGDYYESRVALPLADVNSFANITNQSLGQLFMQVIAGSAGTEGQVLPPGTLVQPYPVNYDAAGNFLGQINYGPTYALCH